MMHDDELHATSEQRETLIACATCGTPLIWRAPSFVCEGCGYVSLPIPF